MHKETTAILKIASEKELDIKKLDTAMSLYFQTYEYEDYTKATMVFNALAIVSLLELGNEYISKLTLNTSSFDLKVLLKSIIEDDVYEHYMDIFNKELDMRMSEIYRKLDDIEKQSKELVETFKDTLNGHKEILS